MSSCSRALRMGGGRCIHVASHGVSGLGVSIILSSAGRRTNYGIMGRASAASKAAPSVTPPREARAQGLEGRAPKGAPKRWKRHLGARTRLVHSLVRARRGRRAGAACSLAILHWE
jgi:hypothetical protein